MNDYYFIKIWMKEKEKDLIKEVRPFRLSRQSNSFENAVKWKTLHNIFGFKIYLLLGFIGFIVIANCLY